MSEIEKLMQNAGIKKREIENCTYKNSTPCGHSCDDGEDCPYLEIKNDYPPFTAEKQLKLLLFQINKGIKLEFKNESKTEKIQIKALTDSIAGLINNLWQDLTEEEKAEIKRILE